MCSCFATRRDTCRPGAEEAEMGVRSFCSCRALALSGFAGHVLKNALLHLSKTEVWHVSTYLSVQFQVCVLNAAFACLSCLLNAVLVVLWE